MIHPTGKTYRRWTRKGTCPGCGVKSRSDHSPGCTYREGLIKASKLRLYGLAIIIAPYLEDHQAMLVGPEEEGANYTRIRRFQLIDLRTGERAGSEIEAPTEVRVSREGEKLLFATLGKGQQL